MKNSMIQNFNDEELKKLKEITEWLIAILLANGVARDDLHKRVDDILIEQLKRLGYPTD
jgi:hypothetical protein